MDLTSATFLLLIVLAGGVIGVLADELGRKIGKRRLHFKKIRPKYTARIATFVTGVLVTLVTILLVATVSRDVRRWIQEGAYALVRLQRLEVAGEELKSANQRLEDANRRLAQNASELQGRARSLDEQLRQRAQRLKELSASVDALTQRVQAFRGRVQELRARLTLAQAASARAQRTLEARQEELRTVEADRKRVLAQRDAVQKSFDAVNTQREEITAELDRIRTERDSLEDQRARLQRAIGTLQVTLEASNERIATGEARLGQIQSELAAKERQLRDVSEQLAVADATLAAGVDIIQNALTQPLTFRVREEIARLPVEPNLDRRQANQALEALLRRARLEANERGARPSQRSPVAGIFDRRDPVSGTRIPAATVEQAVLDRIQGVGRDQVLVAYSSVNSFRGQPVALEIEVYDNPLVYRKGDLLAEGRIDGKLSEFEIYQQLTEFIAGRLRPKVRQDRMLPRMGSEESFGEVSSDDILSLVRKVKSADRRVRLRARAKSDVRAADPLALDFEIS